MGDLILRFFLNNLFSQTYKRREDNIVLSFKEKTVSVFNEKARLFHTELKTTSAPDHSICYMLSKDSERVQLIAYRYDNKKGDLDGNGKIFGSLDLARQYAFNKGYIIPEKEHHSDK